MKPTDDELEAAAMQIACKGRVRPQQLTEALRQEGYLVPVSVLTRILAALEPAPDHDTWDAALEAAANEIDCGCDGACMWPHACPKDDVQSIRGLKKGPRHDT